MFTGLIQDIGTLKRIERRGNYQELEVVAAMSDETIRMGESIACDGACLTVIDYAAGRFVAEASQETAAKTILKYYRSGDQINLERALQVGERLGGHFVMGHVDDVGLIDSITPIGRSLEIGVKFDHEHDRLVVEKGSITINGISLTVNAVRTGWLSVNIIPHSAAQTTVLKYRAGQRVNLEFDMIGKYLTKQRSTENDNKLTIERLKKYGW
ncbi:MAG: riboflavin synthase [bacterium]